MLALATTAIAWVILAIITIGWITYYFLNRNSARDELGSEVEMAPNRKPYYDDETLEGPRLERMQLLGVLMLIILVIGLPLYWVFEPDRQAGAAAQQRKTFIGRGAQLFASTADGGFNCAGCHGNKGIGGVAPYTLTDPKTGAVKSVNWLAPALNAVFYRYSVEEVTYILNYGRPFSPMSAWGAPGGGPMTTQQIETLIAYMQSWQIERIGCGPGEDDPRTCPTGVLPEDVAAGIEKDALKAAEQLVAAGKYATTDEAMGEALFNLETASGAYSCARCHTQGWSVGEPGVSGQGAFGWNLTGGSTNEHFATEQDQINFIKIGSENGKRYGIQSQGSGRMPGFGNMLTDEQIKAIVEYVRSL
jgi:mono/diheme cytochrome c family protein